MKTVRNLALAALLAAGLNGAASAQETKIGFIYVGPAADFGYNTSMDLGRKYVESKVPASRPPPSKTFRRPPRWRG